MRRFALLFLFLLSACKQPINVPFLNNSLELDTVIDYTKVDQPPLFLNCKEQESNEHAFRCFQEQIIKEVTEVISLTINKTTQLELLGEEIRLKIAVSQDGKCSLDSIYSNTLTQNLRSQIGDLIDSKLVSIKVLRAATKRGIPVKVKYELPIYFQTKEAQSKEN